MTRPHRPPPDPEIRRGRLRHSQDDDEAGFGVVEVIAASMILMVIVVSFSNILINSLSAALLARQRETAASIASNAIENASALGLSSLSGVTQSTTVTAAIGNCPSSGPLPRVIGKVNSSTFDLCFTVPSDRTSALSDGFVVSPYVTAGNPLVTVVVNWGPLLNPATSTYTYKYSYQSRIMIGN